MSQIIYKITTTEGVYIGKWSGSEHFLYNHIERALGWKGQGAQSRWDATLLAPTIKDQGFKGLSNLIDFKKTGSTDMAQVATQLKTSLNKNNPFKTSVWDLLISTWDARGDLELAEALCIMLAVKDGPVLNAQIDMLIKAKGATLTDTDIQRIFNIDEARTKLLENQLAPEFWFTFDASTLKQDLPTIISEELSNLLDKIYKGEVGKKKIKFSGNKELQEVFTRMVAKSTIKSVVTKLEGFITRIQPFWGSKTVINEIKKIIKEIQKMEGSTYNKMFETINKGLESVKKQTDKILDRMAGVNLKTLLDYLKDWYQNTSLSDVLQLQTITKPEDIETQYKKGFCKFIAQQVFDNAQVDAGYIAGRPDYIAIKGYNAWKGYYFYYYKEDAVLRGSLKDKTFTKVNALSWNFISANWHSMYNEQVAYWLTAQDADWDLTTMPEEKKKDITNKKVQTKRSYTWSKGFVSSMQPDQITIY